MNGLLAALEKSNRLSVPSLRSLYRKLVVRCHPDAADGSESEFVRLQAEYDDALKHLLSHHITQPKHRPKATGAREQFLRALYVYALVYTNRNSKRLLPDLIQSAQGFLENMGRACSKRMNSSSCQ